MEKVYTFFEPIDQWNSDKKLLDLWISNWSDAGFEPIVFNHSDAKQNSYYETFVNNISTGFRNIMEFDIVAPNDPWSFYVFYNYVRFLCYANVCSSEPILIMDYDVYNINYRKHMVFPKEITFQYSNTPCLVSGTPSNFQKYCVLMSEAIMEFTDMLKFSYNVSAYSTFHEMCFLDCLRHTGSAFFSVIENKMKNSGLNFIEPENSILDNPKNKKLVHVSNEYLYQYCCKNSIENLNFDQKIELRYKLALEELSL